MKRSEMRELIKQELLKTVGGDAAKYIAEDILHIVEKAGMKPPYIPTNLSGWEIGKGRSAYKNEWEPEDENV